MQQVNRISTLSILIACIVLYGIRTPLFLVGSIPIADDAKPGGVIAELGSAYFFVIERFSGLAGAMTQS